MSYARGMRAEQLAADHLSKIGMRILVRNYRCPSGEIDIIALDGNSLCFVEIKQRTNDRYGAAIETIGSRKQSRIVRSAEYFLATVWKGPQCPCRFDVVTLEGSARRISLLKNAFEQ